MFVRIVSDRFHVAWLVAFLRFRDFSFPLAELAGSNLGESRRGRRMGTRARSVSCVVFRERGSDHREGSLEKIVVVSAMHGPGFFHRLQSSSFDSLES